MTKVISVSEHALEIAREIASQTEQIQLANSILRREIDPLQWLIDGLLTDNPDNPEQVLILTEILLAYFGNVDWDYVAKELLAVNLV